MYKIKEKPEDFVVEELTSVKPETQGRYALFWLTKTELNTLQAIDFIAKELRIASKYINFAGTKDKNAITTQLISISNKTKEQIEKVKIKDIELKFYGYGSKRLNLGDLEGNRFRITVRELSSAELKKLEQFSKFKKKKIINYFGEQRFSANNADIGNAMIKADFKTAISLILETNSYHSENIKSYLSDKPNNYVNALKIIPKKMLRLYVNAYQSKLWNETVKAYAKKCAPDKNISVPMIGFGMEVDSYELQEIINDIMKREQVTLRDFIVRQMPELSAEGIAREIYVELKEFKIIEKSDNTATVTFVLPKGSYATEALRQIFC